MGSKRMVFLRYENLEEINFYKQTITVRIEGHPYTFNGRVSDIPNSIAIIDGKETPISTLSRIPIGVPGFVKLDELIAVNSGLYHLIKD